ncbi:uncharacterized protein LOC110679358 [Aedes aegypti]|uniref:Regulatory protein zeste n=1 Tax=Aedes aegypti TaxID=7159 RepID=A0A6I8U2X3_AEDAE|nr:uncharacterized protein LOC110679358 [Aedes aegypti]
MAKRPKSQSTNRDQYAKLVEELEEQPDIAKGFAKFNTDPFWSNLAEDLNSLGPPTKTAEKWKRVWGDWKSNIKKKLVSNRKEQRSTGGGPCKIIELSSLEERVVDMAGLTAAVEGIPDSVPFGAPPDEDDGGAVNGSMARRMSTNQQDDMEEGTDTETPAIATSTPRRQPKRAASSLRLLDTQVKQQKQFHTDMLDILRNQSKKVDDMGYYCKQISKRLADLQALKVEQHKEQQRHNLEMEKIALEKLKTKREILALQLDRL